MNRVPEKNKHGHYFNTLTDVFIKFTKQIQDSQMSLIVNDIKLMWLT